MGGGGGIWDGGRREGLIGVGGISGGEVERTGLTGGGRGGCWRGGWTMGWRWRVGDGRRPFGVAEIGGRWIGLDFDGGEDAEKIWVSGGSCRVLGIDVFMGGKCKS